MLRTFISHILTTRVPGGRAPTSFRRLKGDKGASLVEYAFVCLLFLTMIMGIGSFGHALYAYHFVSHAARQATRWAAVNGHTCADDATAGNSSSTPSCNGTNGMNNGPASATDIQNYVKNNAPMGIDSSKVTVNPNSLPFWPSATGTCATTNNAPGCTVQVQVSYSLDLLFPLPHMGPLTLSSTSEMVIAH